MKKALSLILCIMFVFSFTACKKKEENKTTSTPTHGVDVKKYVDAGFVVNTDERCAFTTDGMYISNTVLSSILEL